MFRTSEFWIAIATGIGSVLVGLKVVHAADWENVLWPAIVYIIARLTSKFVKNI